MTVQPKFYLLTLFTHVYPHVAPKPFLICRKHKREFLKNLHSTSLFSNKTAMSCQIHQTSVIIDSSFYQTCIIRVIFDLRAEDIKNIDFNFGYVHGAKLSYDFRNFEYRRQVIWTTFIVLFWILTIWNKHERNK